MLKAVPSHSTTTVPSSCPQTCRGVTVSGNPCKQVVVHGFHNKDGLLFCHNHQSQARLGSIFLKERWDAEKPNRKFAVTGKLNNNTTKRLPTADDNGSMRQLISQFKRLFHSPPSAISCSNAAVAKHSIPLTQKQLELPQARRPPLHPLQPTIRVELRPAALTITSSTPINEKVPVLRQCQAINRNNGRQCSRMFKDDSESFCFQHRKIPLKNHAQIRELQLLPNTLSKDFGE